MNDSKEVRVTAHSRHAPSALLARIGRCLIILGLWVAVILLGAVITFIGPIAMIAAGLLTLVILSWIWSK